jgi:hypothetical protein
MHPTGKECPPGTHRAYWWEKYGDERKKVQAPFCDQTVESKKESSMGGRIQEMKRLIGEAATLRDLTSQEIEQLASRPKVKRMAVENFLSGLSSMSEMEAGMNLSQDSRSYKWSPETVKAIKDGIKLAAKPKATAEATDPPVAERRDPDRSPEPDFPALELVAEKCMEALKSFEVQIEDLVEKRKDVDKAWKDWDLDDLVRLGVIRKDLAKDAEAELKKQREM